MKILESNVKDLLTCSVTPYLRERDISSHMSLSGGWRVVLTLPLLATALFSQVSGRLKGTVTDGTGSAIPGANVSLQLAGSGANTYATVSGGAGEFNFAAIRPESYDLVVEAKGFVKKTIKGLRVDPNREVEVPAVTLDISSVTETVEVTSAVQTVNTSNAEVATTIAREQLQKLPNIGRSPLALLGTQAGLNTTSRGNTTINGQRVSFSNVTIDGINIQDNFIRSNALDFLPNLLLMDQVAEVTLSTSNANPALGGGSSQVVFSTPSGTNKFRGSAYWTNQNNALAANSWFNNRDGIKLPFRNQNQVGGTFGGPIIKNKLFFYGNYEAFRLRQQSAQNRTILTDTARRGIFTYRDSGGNRREVNVLTAANIAIDPKMQALLGQVPGAEKINNYRVGDSTEGFLRNTAGYSFVSRNNRTRDNVTGKFDYILNEKNAFTVTHIWNRDILDRPDQSNDYSVVPKVANDGAVRLLSAAWRWNPTPRLTNELRWGFNWAPAVFTTSEQFPSQIITGMIYSNPLNTFRLQGRNTDTFNFADNASFVRGKHNFTFGTQNQMIRVQSYNEAGITPTYSLGISASNPNGLVTSQLPGISAADLSAANGLLVSLAGWVSSASQTFNVSDRTSGFVNGASNVRNFTLNNYAFYGQDAWKIHRRATLTFGLRWDYFSPVDERNGLALTPLIQNGNPVTTLLNPVGTFDFAGAAAGRPWYKKDLNNFAPNAGLAWDIFGDGKTSFRAGYSLNFVNDEMIRALDNNTATNAGLSSGATLQNLVTRAGGTLPTVPTPAYKVPRTFADNYAINTGAAIGLPHPDLVVPYVQQWNVGIQRSIRNTILDVRYVGNHATKQYRAFDFNQVRIADNGFLDDFRRALNNGNLARAATGTFNPAYNPAIAGSQRLPFFDQLPSQGLLTNATIRSLIETGQVGTLGETYQTNRLNGPFNFFLNPNALGTNLVTNYSNATYNSLQVDLTRRFSRGLIYQANYVYARSFSDASGDGQTRFEPFLDINNPKIEKSRPAAFDLAHVFKANVYYELPMGKGFRFNPKGMDRVFGGWSVAGTYILQSGTPFSVLSGRGTLNRGARSGNNTVNTTLNKAQLDDLFQFRMTGIGPYFANSSAIGTDGRAVAPDGAAPFNGQVFFQPGPGQIGALQRSYFSGPSVWNMNFSAAKSTQIRESMSFEVRFDATNVFNHVTWFVGDQTVTSTNFGRITGNFFGSRLVQLSAFLRF